MDLILYYLAMKQKKKKKKNVRHDQTTEKTEVVLATRLVQRWLYYH